MQKISNNKEQCTANHPSHARQLPGPAGIAWCLGHDVVRPRSTDHNVAIVMFQHYVGHSFQFWLLLTGLCRRVRGAGARRLPCDNCWTERASAPAPLTESCKTKEDTQHAHSIACDDTLWCSVAHLTAIRASRGPSPQSATQVCTHTTDTIDTYHIVPNTAFSMSIAVDDVSRNWLSEGQDSGDWTDWIDR